MTARYRNSILIAAVGLFAGVYCLARPNWRLVSEAELRATLKPELTATRPADPVAQDRYRRFIKAARALGAKDEYQSEPATRVSARFESHPADLLALENALLEGPLQTTETFERPPNPALANALCVLANKFIDVAHARIAAHDPVGATQNYRMAILIAQGVETGAAHWFDLACQARIYDRLDKVLFADLARLTDAQIAQLANLIPPSKLDDPAHREPMLRSCQDLYPVLIDPVGTIRRWTPKDDPEKILSQICSGTLLGPETEAVPTYDARETLNHLNHVVPVALANLKRSYRDQDRSIETYGKRLTRGYPANGAAGKTGFEQWFRRMEYRWVTARVPNAFGSQITEMLCSLLSSSADEASFYRRLIRESVRTRLALYRYRTRHGRPAPRLEALADEKLLSQLPLDPYDGATLRYDPGKKRLWSVGENGKNDHGAAREFSDRGQLDIVWKTP